MKTGTFYGIGVGPGDPELLTVRAVKILESVDYIFLTASINKNESVAGKIISSLGRDVNDKLVKLKSVMNRNIEERKKVWSENAEIILDKIKLNYDCAFISLGDPLIYSTCGYLLQELKKVISEEQIEIIPGITSFQAAAAKAQTVLVDNEEKLSIIPAFDEKIFEYGSMCNAETVVLLKAYKTKNEAIQYIKSKSKTDKCIYVSRLGLNGEIIERDLDIVEKLSNEYLSLFIIK